MEEKANTLNNHKLSRREIILMTILTPLIFCVTFGTSHFIILFILGYSGPEIWFYGPIGVFVILVFYVIWFLFIRLLFRKYKKTKILFTTVGFAFSTSALIIWILEKINISHMFG